MDTCVRNGHFDEALDLRVRPFPLVLRCSLQLVSLTCSHDHGWQAQFESLAHPLRVRGPHSRDFQL